MSWDRAYLSIEEVANYFGFHKSTIERALHGECPVLVDFPQPRLKAGKGAHRRWHVDQLREYDSHLADNAA